MTDDRFFFQLTRRSLKWGCDEMHGPDKLTQTWNGCIFSEMIPPVLVKLIQKLAQTNNVSLSSFTITF